MKKIKITLYNCEIELYVGKTKRNINRILKRHGAKCINLKPLRNAFCFYCCFETKKRGQVFCMSMDRKSKSDSLYHESLHVAYAILDYVGVKHNANNHEALAYLQEHIANKVKKQIKKYK